MKRHNYVPAIVVCLTLIVGALSTGCGSMLVGAWENTGKADDAAFFIESATFKDDGSYVASARKGEDPVRLAGKYNFDGFNLKLQQAGKPERTYGATYIMAGPTLEIRDGKTKQTLKKK